MEALVTLATEQQRHVLPCFGPVASMPRHGNCNDLWWQRGETGDDDRMAALEKRNMIGIEDVTHGHASTSASSTL